MHSFLEIYKNSDSLHHAYYFVEHKTEEAIHKLKSFLEKTLGIETKGNPDFSHTKHETFSIEDARYLAESESRKNIDGKKKVFIIETNFITEEAQNALLKVFEEPTEHTHFFIVSPQDIILPTLRSRLMVFEGQNSDASDENNILKMSLKDRLDYVKNLTEEIKDEEGTKQDAIAMVNQIEKKLYEEGVEKNIDKIKACETARRSLYNRGAPVKMILENLILNL